MAEMSLVATAGDLYIHTKGLVSSRKGYHAEIWLKGLNDSQSEGTQIR